MNRDTNMIHRSKIVLQVVCAALCLAVSWSFVASAQSNVADILAKMPAQTPAEGEALAASLVKLGLPAIKEMGAMLVAPGTGDDANVQYALSGVAKYVTRAGAEAERAMFSGAIIEAVDVAQDKDVKAFLITLLELAGKDEAVAPLARYLTDERLCEPVASALVAIDTPGAADTLRTAFQTATGPTRLSILNALGEIRCVEAVKDIAPLAANEDPLVRQTALYALANIGDPSAVSVLAAALDKAASPTDQAKAASCCLALAQRLIEAGKKEEAVDICRNLLKRPDAKRVNVQCAALTLLTSSLGATAIDDLLAATDGDIELRGRALELAAMIPGVSATQVWVNKAAQASPETRAAVLNMLGGRGDKSALPAVFDALKDQEDAVRKAACGASVRLGGIEAVFPLVAALQAAGEPGEVKALKEALLRLPGDAVSAAAANALATTPPPARKALLEVMAARRAKAHLEAVFTQTQDADDTVRLAAIEALGNVASESELPRLIALLVGVSSDAERSAAQKVVVTVAKQLAEVENRAVLILEALDKAPSAQKTVLLPTLSGLGGAGALKAVVAATKDNDVAVKEAAIRALGDWPDAAALDALMDVAKAVDDLTLQVVALRGYVRLVGAADIPPEDKLGRYKDGMAIAKRPEEQKLVLGGLADVRTVPSLTFVAGYLDAADVKSEAALAVIKIVCPRDDKDKGLTDPAVVEALTKAGGIVDDAETKKKIEAHIAQFKETK